MLAYNVYSQLCPSRAVLDCISNKWTILIIYKLLDKTCQFGELRREIGGISAKVLANCLKQLEVFNFISRVVHDDLMVITVDYSLTPLGKELADIFKLVTQWTEKNASKILEKQITCESEL